METHDDILRYVKGSLTANKGVSESLKKSIRFSLEFCILACVLLAYHGTITIGCIMLAIATFTALILGIATYCAYSKKFRGFNEEYPTPMINSNRTKQEMDLYVDRSMEVLRIGVATVVINMVTIAFALLLLLIALLSIVI